MPATPSRRPVAAAARSARPSPSRPRTSPSRGVADALLTIGPRSVCRILGRCRPSASRRGVEMPQERVQRRPLPPGRAGPRCIAVRSPRRPADAIFFAAVSMSASASTILAALEPSSATNFLAPAARASASPAAVPPVNDTARTSRCAARASAVSRSPVTHVEQVPWPAGFWNSCASRKRRAGARRRRLDDDGVACGDGRRDLLHQQIDRRVERRDAGDHAIGHAPDNADMTVPGCGRYPAAASRRRAASGRGGASSQEFGAALDFEAGHADRLADILADECRDFVAGVLQRGRRGVQPRHALMRRLLAIGGEGGRCRRDGAVDPGRCRIRRSFRSIAPVCGAIRSIRCRTDRAATGLPSTKSVKMRDMRAVHVSADSAAAGSACWRGTAPADGRPS